MDLHKLLRATLLILLVIGGAMLAGYGVAIVLGGQSQRNAALTAMAMSARTSTPATRLPAATAPALQFDLSGVMLEPARATQVAGDEAAALPSPAASTPALPSSAPSLPAPAAPNARPTVAVSPSLRAAPIPSRHSGAPTATSIGTFVREDFEAAASGWPVRPLADWSAGYVDGRYAVRVEREQSVGIAYPVAAGDYRIVVDVAVESGAAGIVFLYSKPTSFLWAGFDAAGSFGVERIDGEKISTLVPWRPVAGPAGETISLEFQRRGSTLTLSSGGRQLAKLEIPPGVWENRYGFVVAPRNGLAVATFDNLFGERLN